AAGTRAADSENRDSAQQGRGDDHPSESDGAGTVSANTVTVKILDKDYQVACPPEQERALTDAARYLDKQMRKVRDSGKVVGLERIAVMVALNSAYELINEETVPDEASSPNAEQVKKLGERIDDALQRFRQMEIG